jgi:uracil-DNA glycosylase
MEPQPIENKEQNKEQSKVVPKRAILRIIYPERDSPVDQTWTIETIAKNFPPISWEEVFQNAQDEIEDVSTILQEQEAQYGTFYPLKKHVFRAFELTRLSDVSVVLIGQDPYYQTLHGGIPRAQGLSFSVDKDDEIPSSLNNMYIELVKTVPGFIRPWHGDITEWAQQGVLLLNSCLTVRPGVPGSHGKIWMGFISKVLDYLAEKRPNTVYILLGRSAQKLRKYISDKAPVIEAGHPSGRNALKDFGGSNIFNQVNEILIAKKERPINWSING